MQLSPPSRHSIPLWSKYSPQHPVLKHPQFMFLPYCQRPYKRRPETLIDASKEVGLEVNIEKTKYMLVSRDQNAGKKRDINNSKQILENVAQLKYLGRTITYQNLI
jgi:hypothetical protein